MGSFDRIALFADFDNVPLTKDEADGIIRRLEEYGKIVFAKFYGLTERRHKEIIRNAVACGYEIAPPLNAKRGGQKVFDNRIIADACELVFLNGRINAVAVVAKPTNLVHFFAKLKKAGVAVMARDDLDCDSLALVDVVIAKSADGKTVEADVCSDEGYADLCESYQNVNDGGDAGIIQKFKRLLEETD